MSLELPAHPRRNRRTLSVLLLVLSLLTGCGGSRSAPAATSQTGPANGAGTGTIQLTFPTPSAQTTEVTLYRFVGLDRSSRERYGPVVLSPSPVITLRDVPIDVSTLVMIPQSGEKGFDAFGHFIDLSSGMFVVSSPLDPDAHPQSIEVSPAFAPPITVGSSQGFSAMARFPTEARYDISDVVEWSVSPREVASVSTTGVTTAEQIGTAQISAALYQVVGRATLVVEGIETVLSLTSSVQPSVSGQTVTFTATVDSPTAGGEVTFRDGAATLGTAVLVDGTASITTSSLSVGSHSITAAYSGDAIHKGSTSDSLEQVVNLDMGGTNVGSSSNPSVVGQSVTFTALVSASGSGSGTPTGTVTFSDGDTVLAADVPLTAGTATFETTGLTLGSHNITVSYSGDGNFSPSTSSVLNQTVNQAATETSLETSLSPSVFGQSIDITAMVTASAPGSGQPTGSVEFFDGADSLGTVPLSTGQATLGTSGLAVGNHQLTAVYSGDSNYTTSTSTTSVQVVDPALTTTDVSTSVSPSVSGQSVTFTATVAVTSPGAGTPTGDVTFFDGATQLGVQSLSGGEATLATSGLSVGSHTIRAVYAGDGSFSTSTSSNLDQQVNQNQGGVTLGSSANPSVFGQSVTFTAMVNSTAPGSGTPTGSVNFKNGAATLAANIALSGGTATFSTDSLSVSSHSITAEYSGDTNFLAGTSSALNQTVNMAATTTSLSSSPNPSGVGSQVTFTAVVAATAPGAGTPSGNVTFMDGSTSLGTRSLSSGQATLSTSSLAAGDHSVTAVYAGDSNFATSTSSVLTQRVGALYVPNKGGDLLFVGVPSAVSGNFANIANNVFRIGQDTAGNFYVSSVFTGVIQKITPEGTVSTLATIPGEQVEGLACDSGGNVYASVITADIVVKITPDGSVSTFASVSNPDDIVIDSSDNLYVAARASSSPVVKITPGGAVTTFVSSTDLGSNFLSGITLDPSGNIYVVTTLDDIRRITPAGVVSVYVSGVGECNGLAFDSSGNLYSLQLVAGPQSNIISIPPGGGSFSTFKTGLDVSFDLLFR